MRYVYLASPYSHPDFRVREERYREACYAAVSLMRSGFVVYSPIAHSHPLSEVMPPMGHEFWMQQCIPMLAHASELAVLAIPGYAESAGVKREIEIATSLNMPVTYMESCVPKGRRI